MQQNQAKINEMISWLDEYDKTELQMLRSRYPFHEKILELGTILKEDTISNEEYLFRLDVSRVTLNSTNAKAEELIQQLKKRLKRINNVQLISQIIVLISGATILSIIQKEFGSWTWIKYIAPSLVLLASILTIVVKNRSESFISGNENLYEITNTMMGMTTESKFLLQEIEVLSKFFHAESAQLNITSANNLARKLNDYIKKTGM